MRYGADHKAMTRQRILQAAAVVFRRLGFQAASVDHVMAEAGLTAGGFYAHFATKEDLFHQAFLQTLQQGQVIRGKEAEHLQGSERIQSIASKYLSRAHRKMPDRGCPLPPLLAELPRQSRATRDAFQLALNEIMADLRPHLAGATPAQQSDRAIALLATMIGGLSLSRAVADETTADQILAACRRSIDDALQRTTSTKKKRPRPQSPAKPARKKGKS